MAAPARLAHLGDVLLTLGLGAAFAQGPAAQGDQVVFARTRVVVKGGPRNSTLTFKHPYGELTTDTDGAGRLVQDISPAVGNFTAALAGNFGPFLKWDPAVAPAGYVGDPGIAHKVVGGKNGYNGFSVTGGNINVETTDLTIQGKIATNTGVTGDYAIAGNGFLDVFATSRGESLQVDGVAGGYATTPLEHDDGTERQYARIALADGVVPTQVTARNIGDKPASTAVIKVSDLTVTEASTTARSSGSARRGRPPPATRSPLPALGRCRTRMWSISRCSLRPPGSPSRRRPERSSPSR